MSRFYLCLFYYLNPVFWLQAVSTEQKGSFLFSQPTFCLQPSDRATLVSSFHISLQTQRNWLKSFILKEHSQKLGCPWPQQLMSESSVSLAAVKIKIKIKLFFVIQGRLITSGSPFCKKSVFNNL